jgi:putative alpha-1,2-mannosidase
LPSSFISEAQADLNLKRELGNDSFETTKVKAKQSWNKQFNKILVEGGTIDSGKNILFLHVPHAAVPTKTI